MKILKKLRLMGKRQLFLKEGDILSKLKLNQTYLKGLFGL